MVYEEEAKEFDWNKTRDKITEYDLFFWHKPGLTKWVRDVRKDKPCAVCNNPSEDAHHLLSRVRYPELMLNLNNGIALCQRCHYQVHGKKLKSKIL